MPQTYNYSTDPFSYMSSVDSGPTLVDYQKGAKKTMSRLYRAQWEDYKRRFQPLENMLMEETSYRNPELVDQYRQEANQGINAAYDAAGRAQNVALGRYGQAPTPEQTAVNQRLTSLSKTASIVNAASQIRQRIVDRNSEIVLGGVPNAGRSYGLRSEGQSVGG